MLVFFAAMKDQENQLWDFIYALPLNVDETDLSYIECSLSPTLAPDTLASQMISIINSGYSAHLITPHFAAALLPLVRVLPDWYRYLLNTVSRKAKRKKSSSSFPRFISSLFLQIGRTQNTITDEGNREQHAHYTIVDELDRRHGLNFQGEKR